MDEAAESPTRRTKDRAGQGAPERSGNARQQWPVTQRRRRSTAAARQPRERIRVNGRRLRRRGGGVRGGEGGTARRERSGGPLPATPSIGSALARGGRGGFTESGRLVLDLGALVAQHAHVLASVVSAEEQLPSHGQGRADVGLSATSVAAVQGGQRLDGGESSSHVSPFGSPHVLWGRWRQSLGTTSNRMRTFPITSPLRPERNDLESDSDHIRSTEDRRRAGKLSTRKNRMDGRLRTPVRLINGSWCDGG